jgi:adenosylhomocysteine nucleosidase
MLCDGPIGVMAAMPEELEAVTAMFEGREPVIEHGNRVFHRGAIGRHSVVAAYSRCGKVAAAATATELIVRFEVKALIFTGLAGGIGDGVCVGDIVVPEALVQHDLDARPLFRRFEVPLMGESYFQTDVDLRIALSDAAGLFLESRKGVRGALESARVHGGVVATGDQFIASEHQRCAIREMLPDVVAVDMEAGAVGQVAVDYGVPVGVVRMISDAADESACSVFSESLERRAGLYAEGIFSRVFA